MVKPHYNEVFKYPWHQQGYHVVYQPSCLQRPYDGVAWNMIYPDVAWTDRTIVLMHAQDFVTLDSQGSPELRNIQTHWQDHGHRVVLLHWNYALDRISHGLINLIHFPTHSYEILQRLASPRYQGWQDLLPAERWINWQCLNGQARPHRRLIYQWLKDRPGGHLSFGDGAPLGRDSYRDEYRWERHGLELNERNFLRLHWVYGTARVNIVTETQYELAPGIISEKTLFAFLACQIPLVIGYRGIVQDCRDLGFDMFDDIVDTSYDLAPDQDRWRLALELNQSLLLDPPDLRDLWPRLVAQRSYVLHTWPQRLINHHDQRVSEIQSTLAIS